MRKSGTGLIFPDLLLLTNNDVNFLFNLGKKIPSCSGGTISLQHWITPSLLHFPLDIWKPGGAPI